MLLGVCETRIVRSWIKVMMSPVRSDERQEKQGRRSREHVGWSADVCGELIGRSALCVDLIRATWLVEQQTKSLLSRR